MHDDDQNDNDNNAAAVQRFFAMSKLKEASALREDAFQLYDLRKAYVHASMDYTARAIRFKLALDRLLLDQVGCLWLPVCPVCALMNRP